MSDITIYRLPNPVVEPGGRTITFVAVIEPSLLVEPVTVTLSPLWMVEAGTLSSSITCVALSKRTILVPVVAVVLVEVGS